MGRFSFGWLGRLRFLEKRVLELSIELERVERQMATMADLNAAVDGVTAKLADAVTKIEGEFATLNAGQDTQPVIDRVNALGATVDGLVAAVVPAPPAG